MSSKYAVHVSNLSPGTTKEGIHKFFSLCGKIKNIDFRNGEAIVDFENSSAVTTARMLNGGTLDGSKLVVKAEEHEPDEERHEKEVRQEDKPRAGIAAEYLAKGYVLHNDILERAIQIDQEMGISTRFLGLLQHLDSTIGQSALGPEKTVSGRVQETLQATMERAKNIDEQKGYSHGFFSHLQNAAKTPIWQQVRRFYADTSKQVQDIHEEAKRLADHHKGSEASAKIEKPKIGDNSPEKHAETAQPEKTPSAST